MTYNISHLCIFLIEVSFKIYCSFLKLLSFLSYFDTQHFIRYIFFRVFSQSLAYPFFLLLVSFVELKFLNLWSSAYQFFFFFTECALGVIYKNSLPNPCSPRSPMLSSWNFMGLSFPFRSVTHIEINFNFVKGESSVSRFFRHFLSMLMSIILAPFLLCIYKYTFL